MKVSIVIPCFNSEKYVSSCIESCLNQDHEDLEVIAVDDGSSDHTCGVVESLALRDSRVLLIRGGHGGACRARNTGFASSTGSLIKFLDSDDYLAEGAIADQVSRSMDGERITFGYFVTVSEDGRRLRHDSWTAYVGSRWIF